VFLPGQPPPPSPVGDGAEGEQQQRGTRSPLRRNREPVLKGEEEGKRPSCRVALMFSRLNFPIVIIPAGIKRWRGIKVDRQRTVSLSSVITDAPSGLSLIGCTGPPVLPGILRTRPACLLEWARRTDCGLLLARSPPSPPPAGCVPPTTPLAREPCGPEPEQPPPGRRDLSPCRPPALPGILQTPPARLLEWDLRTDCGLLLARCPPFAVCWPRAPDYTTGPRIGWSGAGAARSARRQLRLPRHCLRHHPRRSHLRLGLVPQARINIDFKA
jgi:hypothetical protein